MEVRPVECGDSGRAESLRGPLREPCRARVVEVELCPVASCLLEVVADDLVLLDELRVRVEPLGEAFVELRPDCLWEPFVGRVADQEVPEAVCVVPEIDRLLGPHELLADKGT